MSQPLPILGPSSCWPDWAIFPDQRPETDTFSHSAIFGELPVLVSRITRTFCQCRLLGKSETAPRGAEGRSSQLCGTPLGGAADHSKRAVEGPGESFLSAEDQEKPDLQSLVQGGSPGLVVGNTWPLAWFCF